MNKKFQNDDFNAVSNTTVSNNAGKNKIQQEFEKWCLEKLKSCESMQDAIDIVKLYEKAMADNKCNAIAYNGYNGIGIRGDNILNCGQYTTAVPTSDFGGIKLN